MTVTTGVVLQGFGRLALARAYLRVEHVLNSIHARATREEAESEGSFLGDGVNGSGRTRVESEGGRKLFLKLNGVSSSLGEVLKLALAVVLGDGLGRGQSVTHCDTCSNIRMG